MYIKASANISPLFPEDNEARASTEELVARQDVMFAAAWNTVAFACSSSTCRKDMKWCPLLKGEGMT